MAVADIELLFTRGQTVCECRLKHGDGTYRWTRCELRLLHDDTGKPVEAVGALLDITEAKRAEEAETKLREQIQQAEKLESVCRLAGVVAHDFNNLLTIIIGYSNIVLDELVPGSPLHESISQIRMAGERAAELTKRLLIHSRRQVAQSTELKLNEIIAEVETMLADERAAALSKQQLMLSRRRVVQPAEQNLTAITARRELILIVEDDEQLRRMVASVLRQNGYGVLEAADLKEALLLSESNADTIHLLLTNPMTPGSTGGEIAQIKTARPSIKVLMMSGSSEPAVRDLGLLTSEINHLQKPFSPEALATRVRDVLGCAVESERF